jgi:hypothetical protein
MKMYRWFVICLMVAPAALCLASCDPPTEEEIQEEFNQAVAASNDCETDADCVLVTPGCPLGCGSAVNIEYETEIRNLAKKLIFEWQLGGKGCDYSCPCMIAVCSENKCEAVESSD